jgi:hypothetical protein
MMVNTRIETLFIVKKILTNVFFVLFAVLLFSSCGPTGGLGGDKEEQSTVLLKNRWRSNAYIKVQDGRLLSGSLGVNTSRGEWVLEDINNTYFRIRKAGTKDQYINFLQGSLQSSVIDKNNQAAHWKKILVEDKFFRIENRLKEGHFLNVENGPLENSAVPLNFYSSHWELVDQPGSGKRPEIDDLAGGRYQLQNVASGQYLHVEERQFSMQKEKGAAFLLWKLTGGGHSLVKDFEFLHAEGTELSLSDHKPQPHYKHEFIPVPKREGEYYLQTTINGKIHKLTAIEEKVVFSPDMAGGDAQKWKLERQTESLQADNRIAAERSATAGSGSIENFLPLDFDNLKPVLDSLKSKGLLGEHYQYFPNSYGDIFAHCDDPSFDCYLNKDEQEAYRLFKQVFKDKHNSFSKEWINLYASVGEQASGVFQEIEISLSTDANLIKEHLPDTEKEREAFLAHLKVLNAKLTTLSSMRTTVKNLINDSYKKLIDQWHDNAISDIDDLALNMSMVHQKSEPISGMNISLSDVLSAAGTIMGIFNLPSGEVFNPSGVLSAVATIVEMADASGKQPPGVNNINAYNASINNLKTSFDQLQTYKLSALTTYMQIIWTDYESLRDFAKLDSLHTLDSETRTINQMREETQKTIFKTILPTKAITWTSSYYNNPEFLFVPYNNNYPNWVKPPTNKLLDQYLRIVPFSSLINAWGNHNLRNLVTYFRPATEYQGPYQMEKEEFSMDNAAWISTESLWLLNSSDGEVTIDDLTELGSSGIMNIQRLRALFAPWEILDWMPPEKRYLSASGKLRPLYDVPDFGSNGYYVWYSPIRPESFELKEKEAFIEISVDKISLVDAGNDDNGDIEIRGQIQMAGETRSGAYVPGYSGPLQEAGFPLLTIKNELKLGDPVKWNPEVPSRDVIFNKYRLKIFNHQLTEGKFILKFHFIELDFGINQDDLFSEVDGSNGIIVEVPWKAPPGKLEDFSKRIVLNVPGDESRFSVDLSIKVIDESQIMTSAVLARERSIPGEWVRRRSPISDNDRFGKLHNQYVDIRELICPSGKIIEKFKFWKRGNRLAPALYCTLPDGSKGEWVQAGGAVTDPWYFGPANDYVLDLNTLEVPEGKVWAGFKFWKKGDRLAPALYCTLPDGSKGEWVEASASTGDGKKDYAKLESLYVDGRAVSCQSKKQIRKFVFWKNGNHIAPALYCE